MLFFKFIIAQYNKLNKSKSHTKTYINYLLFVKLKVILPSKTGPAKTRAAGPLLPALNDILVIKNIAVIL